MRISTLVCILTLLASASADAKVFSYGPWNQGNMVSLKMSQLYYEPSIGVNVTKDKNTADFIYFSYGYGKPTKKNAWRKFLPKNEFPDYLPKELMDKLVNKGTDGIYSGMIGIGWNHWFNHVAGFYLQSGWGFIMDLSADDLTEEEKELMMNTREKETFVYNTVPIGIGFTLNMWKSYNIQIGMTYMWKEIPLLTLGVGYSF